MNEKIICSLALIKGGERAAAMYTLIDTAWLNDLNPEAYLRHVLERIGDLRISRISELLPWNVKDGIAAEATSH